MIDSILALGLIGLIFGLGYAGLTPFSFSPVNRVRSLDPLDGIAFDGGGIAYSRAGLRRTQREVPGSISIHLMIRPETEPHTGLGTILSFHDEKSMPPVMVAQWKRRLVVRVRDQDQESLGYWELDAADIPQGEQHLITITSGSEHGTSIYIDGVATGDKRSRLLIPKRSEFSGKLLLGCLADGSACWRGELSGLAFVNRSLSPEEVSIHYQAILEDGFSSIADTESIEALYAFSEVALGATADTRGVPNLVQDSALEALFIPRAFAPPAPKVLHLPQLRDMKADWFLRDLTRNIAGFMPLGFLAGGLLYRRSRMRIALIISSAALLGAALSLSIEVMQIFLPMRASSLSDLYLNVIGAALGAALVAWILESRSDPTTSQTP